MEAAVTAVLTAISIFAIYCYVVHERCNANYPEPPSGVLCPGCQVYHTEDNMVTGICKGCRAALASRFRAYYAAQSR
jgi:hypothetical protein